jgi:hypothetical protein
LHFQTSPNHDVVPLASFCTIQKTIGGIISNFATMQHQYIRNWRLIELAFFLSAVIRNLVARPSLISDNARQSMPPHSQQSRSLISLYNMIYIYAVYIVFLCFRHIVISLRDNQRISSRGAQQLSSAHTYTHMFRDVSADCTCVNKYSIIICNYMTAAQVAATT